MLKRIPAIRLRHGLSSVLNAVHQRGEEFIVVRNGEPMAAVVPADVAIKREETRRRLLGLSRRDSPGNRMSERALNDLINREIRRYRKERRAAAERAKPNRRSSWR